MNGQNDFVDLQINGCFGVDFNADDLSDRDLLRACEKLRNEGTTGALATVITADMSTMVRRVRRLRELRAGHELLQDVIWGLHIEGPFISPRPGFVGAHPAEFVRPADPDIMQRILDVGEGLIRIVTLAPEQDLDLRVTKMLTAQGVTVSAGHCDPSLEQLKAAIDAGISMFTHLGNGCPRQLERHDNIIQRVLSLSNRLWCCLIADGMHLPYFVLGNFLKSIGCERAIVVSDAIAGAGMGSGTFSLGGAQVEVSAQGGTQLPNEPGYFAGSTTTLANAARNLIEQMGLSQRDVHLLTSHNPRQLLGMKVRIRG